MHAFTLASWPSSGFDDLAADLPPELTGAFSRFGAFYAESYPGRRLKWVFARGDMEVKLTTAPGASYQVVLSTLQGLVARAFDAETSALTLDAVAQRTGIANKDVLRAVLASLCAPLAAKEPRTKILVRCSGGVAGSGVGTGIGSGSGSSAGSLGLCSTDSLTMLESALAVEGGIGDEFRVNNDFASRSRRLVAKAPSLVVETAPDGIKQSVLRGRIILLEAAIVKIMKANKTLGHQELCQRVQQQLSDQFVPSLPDVKKRIESLIDRDYLVRDENDNTSYSYIA